MTNLGNHNLLSGFAEAARYHKQRSALFTNGKHFSYDTLVQVCSNISLTISELVPHSKNLVAILAHRSLTAYAGVVGIFASGRGYVRLNPKFPIARTRKILLDVNPTPGLVVGRFADQQNRISLEMARGMKVWFPDLKLPYED